MDDSPSFMVSKRLKAFRKSQGYTLRTLSEMSGVSMNTISLIERGKTSPTIATLHKLATALAISLADFCSETSNKQVIFTKRDQWQQMRYGSVFMGYIDEALANQTMSPVLITFEPEADSGPELMTHAGHELAFCLDGRIQYEINGRQYLLEPGDSLLFEAQIPHRWQNVNGESSQALMVVQSPNGN
ncbi:MAG: helix-turn-helix domain-containing protein [Chloroflexi bacterium]|jgi:transcriptional regulator with XRE-family HTH domain|nr:helix-turn-helix domain-containing protein [Chloroflexota bacterium]